MTHTINEFGNRVSPQTHHFQHYIDVSKELRNYVKGELRRRGAMPYDLWLPETYYLPYLLHKDERIMGSVFGRYNGGRGALIATDQRVLFLDKKPLFVHFDELTYLIIGGVTYTHTILFSYVILHTRLGDYKLRTLNTKNAANFVDFIETKCLQKNIYNKGFESVN